MSAGPEDAQCPGGVVRGGTLGGWMMPEAVSCPKDVLLPASDRLGPLSALNKHLGSFFPSAPLCQVQFCTKRPCLSPRWAKNSL